MANETVLNISGYLVSPYSARGLVQTWEFIDGVFARTINMQLISLSPPGSAKIKTTITGKDQDPPAIDTMKPGTQLTVDCIFELGFITGVGTAIRPVVPFSSRLSGAWTYYRPQLVCMFVKFSASQDEYGAETSWTLELEEI
jgi:hypothetical protein